MAKIAKDPKTGARRSVRHSTISRENAEHYRWGIDCDGWYLVRDKNLSVIEEFMSPGSAEVRHHHAHAQQFFYILDGEVLMEIDGRTTCLRRKRNPHTSRHTAPDPKSISAARTLPSDLAALAKATASTNNSRHETENLIW